MAEPTTRTTSSIATTSISLATPISSPVTAEALDSLLETSKTPQGRSLLASKSLVSQLLLQLPSHPSDPLPILRLLRNLCAGDPSNQLSFLRSDGPLAVSSLVLSPSAPAPIVKVGLQLLANVATAGAEHASAVSGRLFPRGLVDVVLRVGDAGVVDAVCMILYTCCFSAASGEGEGAAVRRWDLRAVGIGVEVVAVVVKAASAVGYRGDWLQLLLPRLCFEETCFPQLFLELGFPGVPENLEEIELSKTVYTVEQAFLLEILSEILEERPYEGVICIDFALSILRILKNASYVVDFTSRSTFSLPTGSPAIDSLGFSLLILKNICALDSSSSPSVLDVVSILSSSGICQFLLDLLRDLEPPLIVRKSVSHGQNEGLPSSIMESSKVCPYKGFRRDIVAVVGNCMFGRKDVQDEVRRQNGILLLLQQCVIDEENPFLREWGIWTVRCLLDRNPENQKEVANLEILGSVNTAEVTELGLRVEIDRKRCRAKLVNMS